LIQTLFRERLQLEQYYYQRGNTVSGEPEKPLFQPLNFGDAKFAARAWRLKFAYDLDVADFEKNYPDEFKLFKEIGGIEKKPNIRTANNNNNNAEEKANIEKIEKALKFERLLPLIEQIEKSLPEDSQEKTVLLERLRFENYLNQQIMETAMDDNIIFPPSWETRSNNIANNSYITIGGGKDGRNICVKLALLGEKEWVNSAFSLVLGNAIAAEELKRYESQDINAVTEDFLKKAVSLIITPETRAEFEKNREENFKI